MMKIMRQHPISVKKAPKPIPMTIHAKIIEASSRAPSAP